MANLSTYYPAPITAADLGLGAGSNATFGSIQNTPIGSTTASSGSFTTLTANNGTLTGASAPVLDLAQTWNASGTTFTGFRFNVTNTASASASNVAVWQIDGSTRWAINRGGDFVTTTNGVSARSVNVAVFGPADLSINSNSAAIRLGVLDDTNLQREGTGVLAQRSASTAQTFNIYNTFTSATNHERGFLKWSSNVFQIGTEKGSAGGTARDVELQSDGITRMRIPVSGTIRVLNSLTNYAGSITGSPTIGIGTLGYLSGAANNSGGLLFYNGNGSGVDARLGLDDVAVLAIRNSGTAQSLRIYNTHTNATSWERLNFRWASNEFILDAEAGSGGGTLRGIKIGSATSSLLGFYGATPVDRPATVADPAGGGTIDTEARTAINDIIDRLQELGLIAT
jgi:hypothetical protein